MLPAYQDDLVQLYHGRSEEILPSLREEGYRAALLLTDPPYFRVKNEPWDRQWSDSSAFLAWLGGMLDLALEATYPWASAFVFASPAQAWGVEGVIKERMRVLNSIRWYKRQGWHQKNKPEELRRFLTPWEAIIFAEHKGHRYPDEQRSSLTGEYAPVGRLITDARQAAGLSRNDLEVALGFVSTADPSRGTALCYRWEEGSSIPTEDVWEQMRCLIPLSVDYSEAMKQHEEYRRAFRLTATSAHTSDIWEFETVRSYKGKHPAEKPMDLLKHMIETTTRPGDLVLDPFAGSSSTLLAARDLGRNAIGIEAHGPYVEAAVERLSTVEESSYEEDA